MLKINIEYMYKIKFLVDFLLDKNHTPWYLFKLHHRVVVRTYKGFELKFWDQLKWF